MFVARDQSIDSSVDSNTTARVDSDDGSSVLTNTSERLADSVGSASASVTSASCRTPRSRSRSRSPSTTTTKSKAWKTSKGRNRAASKIVDPANRTKEETAHLVRLRDNIIEAKNQEVLLLSKQNQGLRRGMDAVEAEMTSMHAVMELKDEKIRKLKRETDRLRRDLKRLHVEGEERKGQQNAMELAATQNTRLLKLLEQEELKREHVLSERDEVRSQVTELKLRVRNSDERYAEKSAVLEVKLIKAIGENIALKDKYAGTDERFETLQSELESTRKTALLDMETAKGELAARRKGQYEVLNQLQESRDRLQQKEDSLEASEEQLQVQRQQSAELGLRLRTVQNDLEALEIRTREREAKGDQDLTMAAARLSKETALSDSLHDKVATMSRTILRLVQTNKDLTTQLSQRGDEVKRVEAQLQQGVARETRAQQKVIRLESSLDLQGTHNRVHGAIQTLNAHMEQSQLQVNRTPPEITSASRGRKSSTDLGLQYGREVGSGHAVWSRRQLLCKYLSFFGSLPCTHTPKTRTGSPTTTGANTIDTTDITDSRDRALRSHRDKLNGVRSLDISDCGLEDADMEEVKQLVATSSSLTSLNLSMNRVGDVGAAALADAFRSPLCTLARLDLRYNQISMRGVQLLSEALEKAKDRGVEHVYVHSQGRIDALGTKLQGSQRLSTTSADRSESLVSVAVVDARDNTPQELPLQNESISESLRWRGTPPSRPSMAREEHSSRDDHLLQERTLSPDGHLPLSPAGQTRHRKGKTSALQVQVLVQKQSQRAAGAVAVKKPPGLCQGQHMSNNHCHRGRRKKNGRSDGVDSMTRHQREVRDIMAQGAYLR